MGQRESSHKKGGERAFRAWNEPLWFTQQLQVTRQGDRWAILPSCSQLPTWTGNRNEQVENGTGTKIDSATRAGLRAEFGPAAKDWDGRTDGGGHLHFYDVLSLCFFISIPLFLIVQF